MSNAKTGAARVPSDIQILADVEADLAAVERLVRRRHPSFQHPTLSKVRALIERITAKKRKPS